MNSLQMSLGPPGDSSLFFNKVLSLMLSVTLAIVDWLVVRTGLRRSLKQMELAKMMENVSAILCNTAKARQDMTAWVDDLYSNIKNSRTMNCLSKVMTYFRRRTLPS
jgi:hypothetical protein